MYRIHFLILSRHTYLLLSHKGPPQSYLRLLSQLETGRALARLCSWLYVLYYMLPHTVTTSEFREKGPKS